MDVLGVINELVPLLSWDNFFSLFGADFSDEEWEVAVYGAIDAEADLLDSLDIFGMMDSWGWGFGEKTLGIYGWR